MAKNFTFRLLNSALILATAPSSVVQTGVKSAGCEKSTPHLSPSHWWKLTSPSVVCAVKSGAVSPSLSAIGMLCLICSDDGHYPGFRRSEMQRICSHNLVANDSFVSLRDKTSTPGFLSWLAQDLV